MAVNDDVFHFKHGNGESNTIEIIKICDDYLISDVGMCKNFLDLELDNRFW